MKKILLGLCIGLLSFTANATELKGKEADDLYKGTSHVRLSQKTTIPDYLRFNETSQPEINMLEGWLKTHAGLHADCGLKLISTEPDQMGMVHYRYQQTYKGIELIHTMYIAHARNGKLISANGFLANKFVKNLVATINESAALQKAKENINANIYKWELSAEEEFIKREQQNNKATFFPTGKLVLAASSQNLESAFQLAWEFDIYAHEPMQRYFMYVDAQSGKIIEKLNRIHEGNANATAVTAYSGTKAIITDSTAVNNFRLRETGRGLGIETYNMQKGTSHAAAVDFTDTDNNWNNVNANKDQYATDAHLATEKTYDFYFTNYGRNSINNAGLKLLSYVHYSTNYVNAFWDGTRMTYGDGNATYNPLTTLDIGGHEVTHGLTSYTANLIYSYQSGALNESFSDIFGTAIENYASPATFDWLIGEDIGSPFRSHSNPNAYGDPDTYLGTNWYTGTGDNGGVHQNSGVQNFWFYLLSVGGTGTNDIGNAYNVTGIGITNAAAIAYRNLTVYLSQNSQYADARFYAIQAATDLFGACSPEVIATTNAWYAVGVGNAQIGTPAVITVTGPSTVCEGTNVLLTANAGTGSTYQWNRNGSPVSGATSATYSAAVGGSYTCSTLTCGSSFTSAATVVNINSIAASIAPAGVVNLCTGQTATLNANTTTGYQYQWNLNGSPISGATSDTYVASVGGNYSVSYIAQNFSGQTQNNSTVSNIVDNTCTATANTTIAVSGLATSISPANISVTVNLTHTYNGDIDVVLQAPNGDILGLSNQAGGAGDNFVNTIFSDAGATTLASGTAPFTGTYKPWPSTWTSCIPITKTSFASLGNGNINPNGNWIMRVYDRAGQDIGTLNNWTLNIPNYTIPSPNCGPATSPITTINVGSLTVDAGTYNAVCTDGTPIALSGTPSGGTFSGTGVTGNNFDPTGLSSGNYTVTYNYSNGTCSGSNTTSITVNARPTINAGTYSSLCENASAINLNGTPSGGTFSGTGVTGNNFNPTGLSGSYSVTYSYIDANGCSNTTNTSITVNALPAVNAGTYSALCANASAIVLSGTPSGGAFSGTGVSGNNFNPAGLSGNYPVTYSYTDANGCANSASTSIDVYTNPSASVSPAGAVTTCNSSTILSVNTGAGYSLQWLLNGSPISGATSIIHNATVSGFYSVYVTNGVCSVTSSVTQVNLGVAPTITAAGSTAVCAGSNITLNAPVGAGNSYQWYKNSAAVSGATSASYITSKAGNYSCVITAGSCSGNSNTIVITIVSNPIPAISYLTPLSFCSPGSVILTANTFAGVTFQWEKNGTNISGATNQSYTATNNGTYKVIQTASGCYKTSPGVAVTNASSVSAVVSANGPTTFCSGGSVTLSVNNAVSGYSYQWKNGGINIGGATASSYVVTSGGSYTCLVSASCGTVTSNAIVVSIGGITATISPAGTVTVCNGAAVALNANSGTGYSYQWLLNGTPVPGAISQTYSTSSGGNYSVQINSACGNALSVQTTINISNVTATISPSGPVTICAGTNAVYSANSGYNFTYQWLKNNLAIPGAVNSSYAASSSGTYAVRVTQGGVCSGTSTGSLLSETNNPIPAITAGGPTSFCTGQNVTFTSNTYSGVNFQWQKNGNDIAGASLQTYVASTNGNYRLRQTANGCSKTSSTLVVTVTNCRLQGDNLFINDEQPDVRIFPNPVVTSFTLEYYTNSDEKIIVSVTDVAGRKVSESGHEIKAGLNKMENEISNLKPGVYFVKVISSDQTFTQKIVKE